MALVQLDDLLSPQARKPVQMVDLTPAALDRVKQILSSHPDKQGQGLRIYVTSGGCAGYSYGMAFDEADDEDTVIDFDGLKVLLDPDSLPWLQGIRVDFVESLVGSGFSITNPNVEASCGCGSSFSKGGEAPPDTGSCC